MYMQAYTEEKSAKERKKLTYLLYTNGGQPDVRICIYAHTIYIYTYV